MEDQNIVEDEFQDLLSRATGLRILINRTVFTTVESGSLLCLRIRFSLSADTWDGSDINFPARQVSGDLVWAEKIKLLYSTGL